MSFQKKRLYLAGPITGCDYNAARFGWRKAFVQMLADRDATHLECYSPMREKEFLEKEQCISGVANYSSLQGFGSPHGILARDSNDVRSCDAMIACYLGATIPSLGTAVEFGIALENRKPIIMVIEPAKLDPAGHIIWRNPNDHLFLRACAPYIVPSLENAADIAVSLLTPSL